jgi:hypothetical protein
MGSYKECEGFSATADYQRVVGSLSDAVNVSRSRRRDVVSQRAGHGRRTSPQTTLPGDDLKPAWRVACVAYSTMSHQFEQPSWHATRAAILYLRTDIDERVAGRRLAGLVGQRSPTYFHTGPLWRQV